MNIKFLLLLQLHSTASCDQIRVPVEKSQQSLNAMNASPLMNEWIRFGSPSLVEQICRGSNRQQVARQIWVSVRPPELCKLQGHCNLDKLLKLLWAVTSVSSVTFLLNRIAANCIKVKLKCCNFCILPLLYRRYSTMHNPANLGGQTAEPIIWVCITGIG